MIWAWCTGRLSGVPEPHCEMFVKLMNSPDWRVRCEGSGLLLRWFSHQVTNQIFAVKKIIHAQTQRQEFVISVVAGFFEPHRVFLVAKDKICFYSSGLLPAYQVQTAWASQYGCMEGNFIHLRVHRLYFHSLWPTFAFSSLSRSCPLICPLWISLALLFFFTVMTFLLASLHGHNMFLLLL